MSDTARVRFAPSPTGAVHIGNVRTAIFNWLFARHHGGSFLIRVEDTDQDRNVEGTVEVMLDALKWLRLDWDEGPDKNGEFAPYYQSQRLEMYHEEVARLIERGGAYHCYCSPERLEQIRREQERRKEHIGYDRHCRDLSEGERIEQERSGVIPAVRFKMPLEGVTTLHDLVHGEITFENKLVDDFIILRSDGYPTYHLASVVDDHYMRISHVMRADDWISTSPRHVRLYEALGWEPPKFAHLPMILAPDRSKLSKRHGATSLLEYRYMGYLPEALVNFLSLLGWSLDDKTEIISMQDLVRHFSIERVSKSGAIFNKEKLDWMNGYYIRQLSREQLADALLDYWRAVPPRKIQMLPDRDYLLKIVPLIQERLKTLADAEELILFFFKDEVDYDPGELVQKGMDAEATRESLRVTLDALTSLGNFDEQAIEQRLRAVADELNVKPGQLFGALRMATSGQKVAPPLFGSLAVLGRERTLADIRKAIESLEKVSA